MLQEVLDNYVTSVEKLLFVMQLKVQEKKFSTKMDPGA